MRSPQSQQQQRLSAGGSFVTPLRSQFPFSGSSLLSVSPLPYSRRRLNASVALKRPLAPTQNLPLDVKDRIARTLTNVQLPLPHSGPRDLDYAYTNQLVDTAPLETFQNRPPSLPQAIAEFLQTESTLSPSSATPSSTATRRNMKFGIYTGIPHTLTHTHLHTHTPMQTLSRILLF